jgi:hypothetical protein
MFVILSLILFKYLFAYKFVLGVNWHFLQCNSIICNVHY